MHTSRPMHHAHAHRCSSTLRGSPGSLSHAPTVRAAPHGGTVRAVACKWGRSRGRERGSIARGGLSGDMEGYQMISGTVDCGVTSEYVVRPPSARVCVMRCVPHARGQPAYQLESQHTPLAPRGCALCTSRAGRVLDINLKSSGAPRGLDRSPPYSTPLYTGPCLEPCACFVRVHRTQSSQSHTDTPHVDVRRGAPGPPATRAGEPSQGSFSSP